MPKIKTPKGIAKRFKVSKTGKVIFKRAGSSHLLTTKSRKRKRRLRTPNSLAGTSAAKIRAVLPR